MTNKKLSYYIFGSSVVLFLTIGAQTGRIGELILEAWYTTLMNYREHPIVHDSNIVVLQFDNPAYSKAELQKLTTIFQQSGVKIIAGPIPPLEFRQTTDDFIESDMRTPLFRSKERVKLYHFTDRGSRGSNRFGSFTADMYADEFPVFYMPTRMKDSLRFGDYRDIDFGVGIVRRLCESDSQDTQVSWLSAHSLRLGTFQLPVNDEGRTIINYYSDKEVRPWGHTFPFRVMLYFDWFFTLEDTIRYIRDLGGEDWMISLKSTGVYRTRMIPDESLARKGIKFERHERYYVGERLDFLKGKIVLIGAGSIVSRGSYSFSSALIYASIIQNILDQEFLLEPRMEYYLTGIPLMFALLIVIFLQLPPWKALGTILLTALLCCFLLVLTFFRWDLLINPAGLFVMFSLAVGFFSPYEVFAERRKIFEERTRLSQELRTAHDMQMGLMPTEDLQSKDLISQEFVCPPKKLAAISSITSGLIGGKRSLALPSRTFQAKR